MGEIEFTFQREKAIEVILYLAHRALEPDFHSINKILYVADKISLEKYGRFICGDSYHAMRWGPVPTNTYDLMKHESGGDSPFKTEDYTVIPLRDADLDQLSESDIECLDVGLDLIGNASFGERHRKTADAAYQKAWDHRGASLSVPISIEEIARQLKHSEKLIHYLSNRG